MIDREPNRRTNDALQGGEGYPAYGDSPGDLGAGRQTTAEALTRKDAQNRRIGRDTTLPRGHAASTGGERR
jgi:hypothetical protein